MEAPVKEGALEVVLEAVLGAVLVVLEVADILVNMVVVIVPHSYSCKIISIQSQKKWITITTVFKADESSLKKQQKKHCLFLVRCFYTIP